MPPLKEIRYDRETRDYAMYLDGQLVGFARTYQEGEATLDQLVFEQALHTAIETADLEADMAALAVEEMCEQTSDGARHLVQTLEARGLSVTLVCWSSGQRGWWVDLAS